LPLERNEMKKATKTASISLIAIVVIVSIVSAVLYFPNQLPATPQIMLPSSQVPDWQIKVSGNVQEEKIWTLQEITHMPLTTVTAAVDGENASFVGVALIDFCNKTGAKWDTEKITVTSTGGQSADLNIFQAWNSTAYPYYQETNRIVLAFVKNGGWMTHDSDGPVKLVTPSFGDKYQIESVSEVKFEKWTISISGEVATPLTFSSENLNDFEWKTVHGPFVPGDGERVSNWTGISMLDVLEASGMAYRAEKLTVVAIDGYTKNFTLQEVAAANMLIGFEENEDALSQQDGGPYRTFCPVEKYKWAQFWVKFVSEIIVS
jgi:DMSO/TMAO reductase YedYZ molybdopterin-dependent catalytic subunit